MYSISMVGYLPYIIFIIIIFSLSIGDFFCNKKNITKILLIIALLIYLILGVMKSNTVGIDSSAYSDMYNTIKNLSFYEGVILKKPEFLFYGMMYIFSNLLNLPEIIFNFFNFSVICFFLYLAFRKFDYPIFVLLIYFGFGFFSMSFSGIRQAISISITTFSILFLVKRWDNNKVRAAIIYYAFLFLAVMYHKSALFLSFIPLLLFLKVESYMILPIALFCGLFLKKISSSIFILFTTMFDTYYGIYLSRPSIMFYLLIFLIFVYYIIFHFEPFDNFTKNRLKFESLPFGKKDSFFFLLIILSIFFISFNEISPLVSRLFMFLYISPCYFIYKIVVLNKTKKTSFILYSFFGLVFSFYFIFTLTNLRLVPYEFI